LDEVQEIVQDQEEYFHSAIKNGRDEESLLAEFGDPKGFAREILAESSLIEAKESSSINDQFKFTWKAAWLTLLLTPLNVFIVWIPFLIVIFFVFIAWILVGSTSLASVSMMVAFLFELLSLDVAMVTHLSGFFILLGSILLNLSLILLGAMATRLIFKKIQSYIRWNLKIIKQSGIKRDIK
jgi:uncharacterized membrane protein